MSYLITIPITVGLVAVGLWIFNLQGADHKKALEDMVEKGRKNLR